MCMNLPVGTFRFLFSNAAQVPHKLHPPHQTSGNWNLTGVIILSYPENGVVSGLSFALNYI